MKRVSCSNNNPGSLHGQYVRHKFRNSLKTECFLLFLNEYFLILDSASNAERH